MLHFLSDTFSVAAQQAKVYHVGIIHQGGPYKAVVDGLRDGLKQSGLEEGKRFVLEIRDAKGDIKAVEEAARNFERDKTNMIYAVTTSAVTAVKNVSSQVPIVFAVGSDPVASALVQSFVKPGGRLTGVQYSTTDLTGKRLEILKEILPNLGRIVIIYNPNNRIAVEAAALARQVGKQFGVQVTERHVTSVEELRLALGALKAKEADAYFYTSDAMVTSQANYREHGNVQKIANDVLRAKSYCYGWPCELRSEFSRDRPPLGQVCSENHDRRSSRGLTSGGCR